MTLSKLKKLAIVCGGTGGHFYPGLSVARTLRDRGGKAHLCLERRRAAGQAEIAAKFGVKTDEYEAWPLPKGLFAAPRFATRFLYGYWEALGILRDYRPDAVLGMGSFTSAPMCLAAITLKTPLFLHDGNARIGKANRFFSRWAKSLMTAFPPVNAETLKCPYDFTGMPLRPEVLAETLPKARAIAVINERFDCAFKPDKPTLLVFGGSQGAETLNQVTPETLASLKRDDAQVIHLTGKGNTDATRERYGDVDFELLLMSRCEEMAWLYSAADLIVCRSGGSTVAELCYFGKYATLVPYPHAAENHQADNAAWFAQSGAGTVIVNDAFTRDALAPLLSEWLNAPERFAKDAANAKKLAKPNAADSILKTIDDAL